MSTLFYTQIDDSPVGPLLLAGDQDALHVLSFGVGSRPREIDAAWIPDTKGVLKPIRRELDEYFAGRLKQFSTRVAFNGTQFQNTVWQELRRIPYGETISYLDLANRIRNPKAVRAVRCSLTRYSLLTNPANSGKSRSRSVCSGSAE